MAQFLLENLDLSPDGPGQSAGEDFAGALRRFAAGRSGKGVVVLLSDFLIREGYKAGLGTLADTGRAGYDTTCVQVLSPGELDPALEEGRVSGDLHLLDNETGQGAEVTVTPELLEKYKRSVRSYCEELAHFCRSRSMRHVLALTDTPIEEIVSGSLRRLGVVG